MSRLLLILILTLSFQSWTKADDISDFEVEGMSIGDSLLDFYSEQQVKDSLKDYYISKEFSAAQFIIQNDKYNHIDIHFKSGDKNYIIYGVDGIFYSETTNECIDKINLILKDMSDIFSNQKKRDLNRVEMTSGHGYIYGALFMFKSNDYAEAVCYDYKKEIDLENNGRVALTEKNLSIWMDTVQYK